MKRCLSSLRCSSRAPLGVLADEPPSIEHHPVACTVSGKAISLCAAISDDQNVSAARVYFRRAGEDFYSFVDMSFGGINYCGTLPAPREGKLKVIEYYVQAVDDSVPGPAHEHVPVERRAGREVRVPAHREGCQARGVDQGVRHEQEAERQARRGLRPHRGHLRSLWAASSSRALLPLAFLASATLARARAPLEVSGALLGTDEDVKVRVDLEEHGRRAARESAGGGRPSRAARRRRPWATSNRARPRAPC